MTGSTDWNAMDDEAFRSLVRAFFEANYPSELRYPIRRLHWPEIRDWYAVLARQGWGAPAWPTRWGGMGLSPEKLLIFMEEQEAYGVARTPDMGITLVGPLLIQAGTDEQRSRYLPRILSGMNIWCQGYSEPNAGSDLASLRMSAVSDGNDYVVNGQKTWTTLAQDATHIFLLVRTDPAARKQEGISFLLVDMTTPGITVRPIRNIAGHEEFCEVFFDNVRVPKGDLVGEPNRGWGVAKSLLGFERIFLGSPKQSQFALGQLSRLAKSNGLFADPVFADRFARLHMDVADLASLYTKFADIVRSGQPLGPEVSILKIFATETFSRIADLMLEAAGSAAPIRSPSEFGAGPDEVLSTFFNARPATIYGGSSEIQRSIVAKNVLGLG
jgi:alkylation response protein AidB-like acyl-CoA dehydrogenase